MRGAADAERSGVQRDPRRAEGQALRALSRRAPRASRSSATTCKKLEGRQGEGPIKDPFTVVTAVSDDGDKKDALQGRARTTRRSRTTSTAISGQLKAAAEALGDKEPALKAYLLAAAQAFTDDKWWPADEAWAKMDAKNSK